MDSCVKQTEFRSILFALCYFHSTLIERKKFGVGNLPHATSGNWSSISQSMWITICCIVELMKHRTLFVKMIIDDCSIALHLDAPFMIGMCAIRSCRHWLEYELPLQCWGFGMLRPMHRKLPRQQYKSAMGRPSLHVWGDHLWWTHSGGLGSSFGLGLPSHVDE